MARRVADIKGLTAAARRTLEQAGITTIGSLLEETSTDRLHRSLARKLGVEESVLTDWVNRADLMRIKGIGMQFANLLESCGVASCRELRQRNSDNLLATLTTVNEKDALVSRLPTLAQVREWIARADELVGKANQGEAS